MDTKKCGREKTKNKQSKCSHNIKMVRTSQLKCVSLYITLPELPRQAAKYNPGNVRKEYNNDKLQNICFIIVTFSLC